MGEATYLMSSQGYGVQSNHGYFWKIPAHVLHMPVNFVLFP